MNPIGTKVLVEPILRTSKQAEELKARSGLLLSATDNKYSFEGIPNECRVYSLPKNYKGSIKLGKRYAMDEKSPRGFKFEGKTLFCIEQSQLLAEIPE